MDDVQLKRFEKADEVRTFGSGKYEVVTLAEVTVGRGHMSRAGNGRWTWAL